MREFPPVVSNLSSERAERPPEWWTRCGSVSRECLRLPRTRKTVPSTWRRLRPRAARVPSPPGRARAGSRGRPPAPYPEERRVLLRLVPLLGCVLPGDAEQGLPRVLPAQPRVAPALDLRHQPVAEAQGTPGPGQGSPAVENLPFLPPPGVTGHRGCSVWGAKSGARGDRTPAQEAIVRRSWGHLGGARRRRKRKSGPTGFAFRFVPSPRRRFLFAPPRAAGPRGRRAFGRGS